MNYAAMYQAYTANRAADASGMRGLLNGLHNHDHLLEHVFWANAVIDENGTLNTFYAPLPERKKFNAVSFDAADTMPEVEKLQNFRRLRVTTHRILNLASFEGEEGFFQALSKKNRKKLRWLRNAVPNMGCKIVPLENFEQFQLFEKLYCAQFSKYTSGCEDNQALWRIYQELIRQNRSFSFLLLDSDGNALAAALGYFSGSAYNYTHLTRSKGQYDKYSPGYYLTFRIITKLLAERPECKYFFMGPGEYDYKRALLGKPFAIYRYERRGWKNLLAGIRMKFRCRKEQKLFARQQEEA